MVPENHFKNGRVHTERMKNSYGVWFGHKTINNRLMARGYPPWRILGKSLLTANHRQLRLDWAQSWQNLTAAARRHVI